MTTGTNIQKPSSPTFQSYNPFAESEQINIFGPPCWTNVHIATSHPGGGFPPGSIASQQTLICN